MARQAVSQLVVGLSLLAALLANGQQTKHVMLISVDGLHDSDLAQWVGSNPKSTLADLQKQGITFSEANIDGLTDSFPGLLALTTGGNVAAHQIYFDDSYDRSLWPAGTKCEGGRPVGPPGTAVDYTEDPDKDSSRLDGGGSAGPDALDPASLPLDKSCNPVFPHNFMKVNTIFEVVHDSGGYTAWADKHPVYDFLNGPSGKGVDDLYTPEIASTIPGDKNGDTWTKNPTTTSQYDDTHVDAAVRWINGKDHTGGQQRPVPTLFGFNMQTVSVAQKSGSGAYTSDGTFTAPMTNAMQYVDSAFARLVAALKAAGLYESTAIIISAKHGQNPIDPATRKLVSPDDVKAAVKDSGAAAAHITTDDVALIWLKDASQTSDVVKSLQDQANILGIAQALYGQDLVTSGLAASLDNPRAPNIIIKTQPGVIYSDKPKAAEHGGLNPDDQHVALLVSGGGIQGALQPGCNLGTTVSTRVTTSQVAPTVVRLLGADPNKLQAVQQQKTHVLPCF